MSILNLRPDEPAPEVVERDPLDETPPGLEAIRAFIRKPRPWVRGIRLWLRQFAKWWREFRKWAAENAVPAARRATELAARGADAARVMAKAGIVVADGAKHVAEIGRAWRHGHGRVGRMGQALATGAGQFRDFSIKAARTATSAAAIGDAVGRFRRMLPDPRASRAEREGEAEDSGPARRLVPAPPPAAPDGPAEPLSETPKALRQPTGESPRPQPESAPERPAARPEAATDSSNNSDRTRRPASPAGGTERVKPAGHSTSESAREEARRAELLAELPRWARHRINALRPKQRKNVLWPLIVDILKVRGWTTSADLALILGVGSRNLTRRHLVPLVEAGVLERLYPERVRHPEQAYRVRSESAPDS